jgi:hypothetical protein
MAKPTTRFKAKEDRVLQDMDNLLDGDYWHDPALLATLSTFLRRWGRTHTYNILLAQQGHEEHNQAFLRSFAPPLSAPEPPEPQI